jgi:hypothetical protein
VHGLVPGFLYKLHFEWYDDEQQLVQLNSEHSVISTDTSSYKFRKPISESTQNGPSAFDLIAHSRKLHMDVAVRLMYPGLAEEAALMGTRHMDSAVNTVRVQCTNFESGERPRVLGVEEDELLYNASAAMEHWVRDLREQLKKSQEQLQQAKKQLEEERMQRWQVCEERRERE